MVLRVIGVAFAIASAALFRAAIRSTRENLRLEREGTRVTATVRELKESQSDDTPAYAPIFEFSTPDGKVHRIESTTASYPAPHAVGDKISVLYDPADPAGARVESFTGLWLGAALMGGGAVLGSIVAILCLVLPE
jgi:hypothetical protein